MIYYGKIDKIGAVCTNYEFKGRNIDMASIFICICFLSPIVLKYYYDDHPRALQLKICKNKMLTSMMTHRICIPRPRARCRQPKADRSQVETIPQDS